MSVGPVEPPPVRRLTDWCTAALGEPVTRVLFRSGNLCTVLGVRLRDGREVVVKARPAAARNAGCTAAQRRLAAVGYPCPSPLAGPARIDGHDLTAETYHPGGGPLPLDDLAPGRFAAALAELVRCGPLPAEVPSLDPPPPWAAWDHSSPQLWPATVSTPVDLNTTDRPGWLDDAARRARARLAADPAPAVVGHVDFESQNIRWRGDRLHCVHDWDSVAARPEPTIAGLAAAMFPAVDSRPAAASLEQTEEFLRTYARVRGRPWSVADWELAWAAGLWALAYNACVEIAEGGHALADAVERTLQQRLRQAGA